MPDRLVVAEQTGWNPTDQCWQTNVVYWEAADPLDLEWESEECCILRIPWVLWRETKQWVREGDAVVIRSREREATSRYVVAQRHCRERAGDVWIEDHKQHHDRERWDVDSEFWRRVRREF